MARSRGFLPRTRAPKRATTWGQGPSAIDLISAATSKLFWTNGSVLTNESIVTIVRMRGLVSIQLNTIDAVGAGFFGAVGLGIITLDAFTAGAGSAPGALTDAEWDGWIWHSFFDVRGQSVTMADGVNAFHASQRIEIDSKAMRKFEDSQVLFGSFDMVESTNATVEMQAEARVLLKV